MLAQMPTPPETTRKWQPDTSAEGLCGRWLGARIPRAWLAGAQVHVYNALIAAAERAGQFDVGLALHAAMAADGVAADPTTRQLLAGVGRAGAPLTPDP